MPNQSERKEKREKRKTENLKREREIEKNLERERRVIRGKVLLAQRPSTLVLMMINSCSYGLQ